MTQYDDQLKTVNLQEYLNIRRENNNFQRYLIDDEEEIQALQRALMGIRYDNRTRGYVYYPEDRLLSDQGARTLTETYLFSVIKNGKLTYLEGEEIKTIMQRSMEALDDHLTLNQNDYELKFANFGIIMDLLESFLFTVFKRAFKGMEQERLSTTQKIVSKEEIRNDQPMMPGYQYQEQQGGNWRKWLPGF